MTRTVSPARPITWRDVLPPGRSYVALPNASRPVVVADADRAVLDYLRRALLAPPPSTRVPGWVWEAARRALRQSALWRLAPRVHAPGADDAAPATGSVSWLAGAGCRILLLDHSHDPDKRLVALLFRAGSPVPALAVKISTDAASSDRLNAERERMRELQQISSDPVRRCAPRLVDIPPTDDTVLATTAAQGTSMYVAYRRPGHIRNPLTVRADFDAAASWLAELQARPTGPPRPLDLAPGTLEAADVQLGGSDLSDVQDALAALRRRLHRHHVADRLVHGDFWAGNLLVENGAVRGVVDWERWSAAGSPVRDLARFAASYSLYLDRRTTPGRRVPGHPGLVAGTSPGGVGYALDGTGWYPRLVRDYLCAGLTRLGLPTDIGRDIVLAELAANAAESTSSAFAVELWRTFIALSRPD